MKNKKKILVVTSIVAISLVTTLAHAYVTGNILPTGDGTYAQWSTSSGSTHYTLVDETACNGKTDYVYTTTTGQRDSYSVSLSDIPVGAVISAIEITPCASRNNSGGGSATLNVFYRFDGSNSADAGGYALTGTTPTQLSATTFSGLALIRDIASSLEIGSIYSSGTKGARVSRVSVKVTYNTVPAAPYNLTGTLSTTTTAVVLNWNQSSDNEDGFKIERATTPGAFSEIGTVGTNTLAYQDSTVSSGTYYYRVRAYNTLGDSTYSNTATTTVP